MNYSVLVGYFLSLTMLRRLQRAHRWALLHAVYHFLHESIDEFPCSMSTAQEVAHESDRHAPQSNPMQIPANSNYQLRLRFLRSKNNKCKVNRHSNKGTASNQPNLPSKSSSFAVFSPAGSVRLAPVPFGAMLS